MAALTKPPSKINLSGANIAQSSLAANHSKIIFDSNAELREIWCSVNRDWSVYSTEVSSHWWQSREAEVK